ncbi:histidine phosphatase family protein [Mobilicoccus sp.]|uniref:SixA phosphatase family protein n=1 Tax=Mobilicoccus sp. TaxID=2034349 RepID=UPI0028AC3F0C|nr:histidine phosphatase family protein [Mobilicoccus sp.]
MDNAGFDSGARLLVLMRHGEAEPHSAGGDEDRELTEGGVEDARDVGAWLASQGVELDLAIVSTAVRTRQTWEAMQEGGLEGEDVQYDEAIYNGTVDDLAEVVRTASDDVTHLLVIAHAPAVEDLATCAEVRCDLPDVWEPATIGVMAHPGSWAQFPADDTVLLVCRPGGSEGLDADA